jgi:phage-related protein
VKNLEFMGSSLEDLRNFPAEVRRAAGFQLSFVQQGLLPSDWKPMSVVGPGAQEIRIHVLGEWRVVYVSKWRVSATERLEESDEEERQGVKRKCVP